MTAPRRVLRLALALAVLHIGSAELNADTEREARKRYQLEVPGKAPITILEEEHAVPARWVDVTIDKSENKKFPDVTVDHLNCFGPSCREDGYEEEAHKPDRLEEFLLEYADRLQGTDGKNKERLQTMSSLAYKLKNDRNHYEESTKGNRYGDDEDSSYQTSWNKLKVKKHKHPYDDRDGWVTMEAVPYSMSKVSKWKPNGIRPRPNHWDDDAPDGDRYSTSSDRYTMTDQQNDYRKPTKRPTIIMSRPHFATDWNEHTERPWTQQASYPAAWAQDEGRKPHKNCDHDRYPAASAEEVYYGISDSVVTDGRPADFPYEYQALKRPQRPTQVMYADVSDERRPSHPSNGEGQWVLLSTTKGYHRSKKRPRAMSVDIPEGDGSTVTSHHTVGLTVLPRAEGVNTTTSHGGLLEVERSFQTVEESKQDLDRANAEVDQVETDHHTAQASQDVVKRKKVLKHRLVSAGAPDGSSVLAAVGAGMVPATMAMVVPMMLGKKRRRRDLRRSQQIPLLFRYK